MGYRIHCDWCGKRLRYEDDQAEMPVTIHHRGGKGSLDAKWAQETKYTRFFCAAAKEDTDQGGRNRAGMLPEDAPESCFERAMAVISGSETQDPGMGLQWRLVPVNEKSDPEKSQQAGQLSSSQTTPPRKSVIPDPPSNPGEMVLFAGTYVTAELRHFCRTELTSAYMTALPDAGIVSFDQVIAMTDNDLLALGRVGPGTVRRLREAIAKRDPGLALVRDAFGVIVNGIYEIEESDPMREPLALALQQLTDALAAVA